MEDNNNSLQDINQLVQIRHEKLAALQENGKDQERFPVCFLYGQGDAPVDEDAEKHEEQVYRFSPGIEKKACREQDDVAFSGQEIQPQRQREKSKKKNRRRKNQDTVPPGP